MTDINRTSAVFQINMITESLIDGYITCESDYIKAKSITLDHIQTVFNTIKDCNNIEDAKNLLRDAFNDTNNRSYNEFKHFCVDAKTKYSNE